MDDTDVADLQERLRELRAARKEAIEGNMGFSFGYDPVVADFDRQIAIFQALQWDHHNCDTTPTPLRCVTILDDESDALETFEVSSGPSEPERNVINREADFGRILETCSVGDLTQFGMVVSVDGSPVLSRPQIEALRQERYEARRKRLEVDRAQADLRQRAEAERAEAERQRVVALFAERQNKAEAERKSLAMAAVERQKQAEEENRRLKTVESEMHAQAEQQRQEAKSRQAWLANQLSNARTGPQISLHEARRRVAELEVAGRSGAVDGVQVSDLAEVLCVYCQRGHDAASDTTPAGDKSVITAGGVAGFIFGAITGGVAGAFVGAAVGAGLGSGYKLESEQSKWATLLLRLRNLTR